MEYKEDQIKLAVDIASGGDGHLSTKVIEILEALKGEKWNT